MYAKESDDKPSVIIAWPKDPSPAFNTRPVMVFDLSEPSVAAQREKLNGVFIAERDTWTTCDMPEPPHDLITELLAALGLTAKRKGSK